MPDAPADPPPPADSRLTLHRSEGVVTIAAAPLGLFRGSYLACVLGPGLLLWMAVMVTRLGPAAFQGVSLFLVPTLGTLGLLLTVWSFDLGKARSRITVDRDAVTAERVSVLGTRRAVLPREAVESVGLGEAPFTMSNQPVHHLRLVAAGHEPVVRLTNYPDADLRWAAAVLARELGLTGAAGERDKSRR